MLTKASELSLLLSRLYYKRLSLDINKGLDYRPTEP